jgi:protocatechuate 3,4-dioxygenase, alpha subunit
MNPSAVNSSTAAPYGESPSQTLGPYFAMCFPQPGDNVLVSPATIGTRIRIEGTVFDGDRKQIEDALIELWQANAAGRYNHPDDMRADVPLDPSFTGFGRATTDFATGTYWFETIKPGPVPHPGGGWQAPHLSMIIQSRGMLMPSFTRMYFADEASANSADPVLQLVDELRRSQLVAPVESRNEMLVYRYDIRMQGDDETVFFDI